jgi:hypothetical protein
MLAVVAVPALGYVYMVTDIRAYLRSLRRALVAALPFRQDMPVWAAPHTPPFMLALGLSMPCTEADVLRVYRQRVKQLHPDRGGDMQRFLRLQAHFEQTIEYLRHNKATFN